MKTTSWDLICDAERWAASLLFLTLFSDHHSFPLFQPGVTKKTLTASFMGHNGLDEF